MVPAPQSWFLRSATLLSALRPTALAHLFAHPVSRRRVFLVIAAVLVCLYALSVFWYVLSIPEIGLRCVFDSRIARVYDGFVRLPKDLPPADLERKTVIELGPHPVETWPQILHALDQLRHGKPEETVDEAPPADTKLTHILYGGEELVRAVVRGDDGKILVVWCKLGTLPLYLLVPSVAWFFLKAGLFAIAALVFWKRPEDRSAYQFFLLSIVTFAAYMGGYHWSRIVTQPILLVVFIVCSVLLPAVSLHFYLVFPRPKAFFLKQPHWTLAALYGPAVLFLLTLLSGYLLVRWLFGDGALPDNRLSVSMVLTAILNEIYVYFGVAALWYLLSLVALLHSFWTTNDPTERNQVKWILCGILAAMVPISYTLYLAFVDKYSFGGGAGTWPMFTASACVTVAFAVSITRYRLMQLDQIISSGVSYFLLSSLAGMVYYAVVFAGTLLFSFQWLAGPNWTWVHAVGVGVAALVLLLVLDWLRSRVNRALDRTFYREKYRLDRTLKRMSLAIEKLVDPPTLAHRLLHESADLLGVRQGAVYLRTGSPPLYRLAHALDAAPPLTELSSGCPLVEALLAHGPPLLSHPNGLGGDDPARRQLRLLGGEMAHALTHEGQLLALLVLGPKAVGSYGPEDLNLLTAFAQITALALVSAEGHRTIDALNRDLHAKVEKIAEQQRRILVLQKKVGEWERGAQNGEREAAVPNGAAAAPATRSGVFPAFVGSSFQVRELMSLVRKVSDSEATVLIRGESGTGKELLARALHEHSPRKNKPFIKVHCAALSTGLLESELFGHVKGAFTGAHRDRDGRFEAADEGTLFLDEIGDISLEVQTKLLRVLQERTFERVGSSEPVRVDVRLIAATHQELEQLMEEGRFRRDLFYRLNVITIPVLPLRERREDIAELAAHFLQLHAQRCRRAVTQIDDDALAALKAFPWPGNIRQLENFIQRAVVVADGPTITLNELPPEVRASLDEWEAEDTAMADEVEALTNGGVQGERVERDRREREQLVRALAAANGNKAEAARLLGLHRSTLVSRLKKHGLS
jgi:transcriptional regulator with GAF, ATPase, and Fis domain